MSLNLPPVPDLHQPDLAAALRHKISRKTVPEGALGRMAALAERLGLILGTAEPHLSAPQLLVCAADHGIAARGVSAYPSEVKRAEVAFGAHLDSMAVNAAFHAVACLGDEAFYG